MAHLDSQALIQATQPFTRQAGDKILAHDPQPKAKRPIHMALVDSDPSVYAAIKSAFAGPCSEWLIANYQTAT